MTTAELKTVEQAWPMIAPLLLVPHDETEYGRLVQMLDALIDEVGEEEKHPLASLMEVMGILVEEYENRHVPDIAYPLK